MPLGRACRYACRRWFEVSLEFLDERLIPEGGKKRREGSKAFGGMFWIITINCVLSHSHTLTEGDKEWKKEKWEKQRKKKMGKKIGYYLALFGLVRIKYTLPNMPRYVYLLWHGVSGVYQ